MHLQDIIKSAKTVYKEAKAVREDLDILLDVNNNKDRYQVTKKTNISADKSEPMNIDQMGSSEIKMVCLYMKDFYQNAYKNPSHKQYSCSKSNQLSFTSLKMVHDGPQKQLNDRLIQFLIEHRRHGSITLTLGCEIKNCYEMEADLVRIANSIR